MYRLLLALTLVIGLATSCKQEESKPAENLPPVQDEVAVTKPDLELKLVDFTELNGFEQDQMLDFYQAWQRSCAAVSRRKNLLDNQAQIKISAEQYQKICAKLSDVNPRNLQKFIKANFRPFLVTYKGSSDGKFTSYYEAELNASRRQSEKYRFPIYGRPADLIEFNPHDFDENLPSKRLVGMVAGQKLIPYYTREEIFRKGYKAPVILWADDYVDVYVMQIQGSAVAQLDDGSRVRIGFADTNGRKFKGIGSILLEKGLIKAGQASMGNIKKWLKQQGEKAYPHMNANQRFVFHRLIDAEGPIGAQGVPLTAGRSLAVDTNFVPLGALLWLETTGPDHEAINKMVVAQDIGGAIKGAVRGDYFWGSGHDEVLEQAGKMNAKGRYFVLLPLAANGN